MQFHSNNRSQLRVCDKKYPFIRTSRARFLGHEHRISEFLEGENTARRRVLIHTLGELRMLLWRLDPRIQFHGRIKSTPSILDKMSIDRLGIHQILDIIGIRVVTQHTRNCYRLADRIHSVFNALENEFKDYIASPKPNGYQSIHTTVISPQGFPVEIQIRTQWMQALCERGPAAHSRYKNNRVACMPVPQLRNSLLTPRGVN